MSRLIGRLLILALLPLSGPVLRPAMAQSTVPAMTVVQDRLYRANGTAAQGTVTVRWAGFTTADGVAVAAGELTVTLDAQGNLSIPLAPNAGALPGGGYYKATIKLSDGTESEEVWVVPQAATATLAQIRSKTVPQSVAAQFVTQSTLQAAIAAALATPGPIGIKTPGSVNATVVWTEVVNGEYNAGSFSTLQSAIATATASGVYKVKIPEGTYKGNLTLPSGVTLECVSRKAVLTIANGANVDVVTIPNGAANVTIHNCTIDGDASSQTATSRGIYAAGKNTNITLDNVTVQNTQDVCVLEDYAAVNSDGATGTFNSGVKVTNSRFVNCGAHGVKFSDSKGVWVQNNYFENWGAINPHMDAIGAAGYNSNVHINGNTGVNENSTYWFMESSAGSMQQVILDADISGNTVTGTGAQSGAGFSGYFFNTVFANNVLTMPGGTGCGIGLSMEVIGQNDTFDSNTLVNGAIVYNLSNAVIAHNNFVATCPVTGLSGLILSGNADLGAQNIKVQGNNFDLTGIPSASTLAPIIVGWYGTAGNVNGFEISGNTIRQNANNTNYPIVLVNSDATKTIQNVSIHDNIINTNGGYAAASVYDNTKANVNGVQVYGNDFSGSPVGFVPGAALNVTQWNNRYAQTDTQQHLNGGAAVDATGGMAAPGGIGNGLTSAPPSAALVGWYQAGAACTVDGSSLASWPDSSASGVALASGTTPGTCKLNVVNGQATVRFTGSQTGYQGANSAMTGAQTVFVVYRKTAGTTGYLMDSYTFGNFGSMNATAATTLSMQGATTALSGTIPDDGSFHIAAYSMNNQTGVGALYEDGAQLATGTPGGANLYGLTIGAEQTRASGMTGDIAEVLVYNTVLPLAQVQSVDTYLAAKYGLTAAGSWVINSNGANVPKLATQQACLGTNCITTWPAGSSVDGNTIAGSATTPASGTGTNGDYYVVASTGCLWGPKASGAWPGAAAFCPGSGTGSGTITGVTAGTGLTGGGTSGAVTLSLANTSTTVNGQSCALGSTCTVADATKVPTSTTVNGHALSSNVTVTAGDVGNTTAQWNANQVNGASVPTSAAVVGTNSSGQLVSNTRYAIRTCGVGLGDGTNAITAGMYTLGGQCRNVFGVAFTITGVACYADSGSTTINVSDSSSNALLTGAITGANTWTSGTQSATTALASGAWTTWTIVADGSTKLVSCTLTGTI